MGNFIGTARDGSHINFTFIDSVELPQSNGVIYNSIVIELNTTAGEAAADELFDVLNSIKCRKRIQMPFWEPELYKTGKDNISITFVSDDAKVDLSFLSGNITIYDIGTKNRSFKVSDYEEAFNSLAEVARKYGTEHAAR